MIIRAFGNLGATKNHTTIYVMSHVTLQTKSVMKVERVGEFDILKY